VLEGIRKDLVEDMTVRRALSADAGVWARLRATLVPPQFQNFPVADYLCGVALAREIGPHCSDVVRAHEVANESTLNIRGKTRINEGWIEQLTNMTVEGPGPDVVMKVSQGSDYREKRYQVMSQAPKFYGFALMLLLAGFPIAGLYAGLPGGWMALVNWGKLFVSVKLWPLFWNLLYAYSSLTVDFDTRLVIPAVYLMIPAVSLLFIQLISTAASSAFTHLPVSGSMSGGPVGQVVGIVSKL
jgi:hypothetical protein